MGKKYYLHPTAEIRDGKWVCTYCRQELPQDLRTEFPCSVSVKQPFDDEVEVNVWDCFPRVIVKGSMILSSSKEDILPVRQANKLYRLAVESVEACDRGINTSGIYPPSDKLCAYVQWLIEKGYIAAKQVI